MTPTPKKAAGRMPALQKSAPPTVFIVDDDPGVRHMITRMVRSVGLVPEAFGSVKEFLDEYRPSRPGCLVLDIRMPGESGLDLQARLAEAQAGLPIVFITGHGSVPISVRAMKQGAVDFIEKPFDDQVLLDAINVALSRDADRRRSENLRAEARDRVLRLTPREREVMALVVSGWANKRIASELGTTEQTVKMHRGRVMSKTGAESVPDLVVLAQLAGDIDDPASGSR
jgi:FixJ family two-component response regulator